MLEAALIGAGNRGNDVYGGYALEHPEEIRFVAIAEPDAAKRKRFAELHGVPENRQFVSWQDLMAQPKLCDLLFICSLDRMHYEPTLLALDQGYHVMLEKPMATELEKCIAMVRAAKLRPGKLTVAHVLRYTPFFGKIKELISSGAIGEVLEINLDENVGYWHYAHSYVRGNWANSRESSPMILAKSCHDMDLLVWLSGKKPLRLASLGSLQYFKSENAPEGSAERCLDCPLKHQCPYSAVRQYLGQDTGWPVSVISQDLSIAARVDALRKGPYGRCVYKCDNNVVDHQTVHVEFEGGTIANFTMCGLTHELSREIKIMGTLGIIQGKFESNRIAVHYFGREEELITTPQCPGRHGGGDYGLMEQLIKAEREGKMAADTSAEVSLSSHVMAFAAEESRLTGRVIQLDQFSRLPGSSDGA
jgi:predicted dehydrogenase